MNPGDFVVETWRDADRDPSKRWQGPIPVWKYVGMSGSSAMLESVIGAAVAVTAPGDLRPATDEELARVRERAS